MIFDQYLTIAEMVQDRDMWKANRNSVLLLYCTVLNGATDTDFGWPLSNPNDPILHILNGLSYLRNRWREMSTLVG